MTNTSFEANAAQPDRPLEIYAERRQAFSQRIAVGIKAGDDPAVVAKAIVAAATDPKPKLRYPAGAQSGCVHAMRRLVPSRMFDQQIRKLNQLPV